MGELQSCWSWNTLNANSYYDLDKWDTFNIYAYVYSHSSINMNSCALFLIFKIIFWYLSYSDFFL